MKLDDLRDWMKGEHALVVAPGPSSLEVPAERYKSHWTIGCNRALPYCDPDFAVCIEPRKNPCWRVVHAASPLITFTHLTEDHSKFRRTVFMSTDVSKWLFHDPEPLFLGMSPFFATAVGILLGFERIGLVGVDLYRSRYPDPAAQTEWEAAWTRLRSVAEAYDTVLCNLNPRSRLQAIMKSGWETMERKGWNVKP